MTQNELDKILENHKKWLNGEDGGSRANLQDADLRDANLRSAALQGADLRGADLRGTDLRNVNLWDAALQGANLRSAALQGADLLGADLRGADLQGANLRGANLQTADLRGADVDYSCWPLGCGSLDVIVDRRIFCQLAYHLCRVIVDDDDCKEAQLMLGRLANEFHWADECGRVPEKEDSDGR